MASSSSQSLPDSSSSPSDRRYDVFLSFRGKDTRNSFTAHLYSALIQKDINAYKDDRDLERGKNIEPELWKAIEESKFSIAIFSNDYASSPWCLDELVKIIQCMETRRQTILPIFYDVDPSDVADQKGSYENAFIGYEEEFKDDKEKVKTWKDALNAAANLSGWDVRNKNESEIIEEIVERIWFDVSSTLSIASKGLVGMDFHLKEMNYLLGEHQLVDVRFLGICGMGGIGKTTIAEVVYDKIGWQFEASCFLANVKEAFKSNGVAFLQEQVISKITRKRNTKVSDVKTGGSEMRRSLKNRKILIILDDVDDLEQLETLAGEKDWFGSGSRVIITSRDRHVLSTNRVDGIYDVKLLNDEEALVLFSHKAFKQDQPLEDYLELSKLVLARAEGLPLALLVLGSFLYGRSRIVWTDAIQRIDENEYSHNKIMNILRISFDGLEESEKQIFLDIACFFKGKDKERVTGMLNACGFHAHIGMEVLIEKSLMSISEYNVIGMHDLLEVMGRSIVKQESRNDPGRRSRLWDLDDIRQVLENNIGKEVVEAIILDSKMRLDVRLNSEAFSNMSKMRILILKDAHTSLGPTNLSNELRYLVWDNYPSKSLPSSFQPIKLVELCLYSSAIKQLWDGYKVLDHLKVLNLCGCNELVETPDFTGIPNLEKLLLGQCTKLSKLHPSFERLEKLDELDLYNCTMLKELPSGIKMKSLEFLDLRECTKLKKFPTIKGVMPRLQRLYLNATNFKSLPNSIHNLTGLVSIRLKRCKNLRSLPSSIVRLKTLEELDLFGCSNLNELPEDIGQLTSLKHLNLKGTAIKKLPRSIFLLENLEELGFGGRGPYIAIGKSLLKLDIEWARKLEVVVIPSLSAMVSLESLKLVYCNLKEGSIPEDIRYLSKLTYLNLTGNNFVSLPRSINQLSEVLKLIVEDCKMLRSLPEIPPNVQILSTNGCIALEEMPDPIKLQNPDFSVFQCFNCQRLHDNDHVTYKMIQQYLKGFSNPRPRFEIVAPGRKIARWFSNHSETSSVIIRIPTPLLDCNSSEWMGFAACVLFRVRSSEGDEDFAGPINCAIHSTINNNEVRLQYWPQSPAASLYGKATSDHCWSFYVSFSDIKELKDKSISHLRLSFYSSHAEVKTCAARLVSRQDVEEEFKTEHDHSYEFYDIDSTHGDGGGLRSSDYCPRRPGFFTRRFLVGLLSIVLVVLAFFTRRFLVRQGKWFSN